MGTFILLFLLFAQVFANKYHVVCYYNWNDPPLKHVDSSLCTHIILIGQLHLDNLGHLQLPPSLISQEFYTLKRSRPELKLLVCLTGPNEAFTALVSSSENIVGLARSARDYLMEYTLDGMDIDWEFPTWSSDASLTDRMKFPLLLKAIRKEFKEELLVTVAVSGPPTITKVAYDPSAFNKYVDLVHVMNYDFHIFSYLHPFVGFNAPLKRLTGKDKLWLSFEDEQSISAKAKYAKELQIAGVMVYHIGSDDVYGRCGNGKSPLLRTINEQVLGLNDS
ncbi:unnamed protein product [Nippostrongylus brasiliensis]|uniref:Glyco_18 domain-containing protein n=1 Tax=Nippostrongylus brasiliensis TaxID=27835 RepID=A0A0N4YEJ9_NIPBR|nr:unnamed protein product [Nippostrongylus brasiliensis]